MYDNAVDEYKKNFPYSPVYHGDIAKLSVDQARELSGLAPGTFDLWDGAPLCQGFSLAGKRDFGDALCGTSDR